MRKSIEELKALPEQEIEAYFKEILLEEYEISVEQFTNIQTFLSEISKRTDLESIIDVIEAIKEQRFVPNEILLALASKVSEVNFLRNKLSEAEQIIQMVQMKQNLEDMIGSQNVPNSEEKDSFPDLKIVSEE